MLVNRLLDSHSEYVIVIFHANGGYANAPQCYIIRTLPVLLLLRFMAMVNVLVYNSEDTWLVQTVSLFSLHDSTSPLGLGLPIVKISRLH